jgi:hypothetical protein
MAEEHGLAGRSTGTATAVLGSPTAERPGNGRTAKGALAAEAATEGAAGGQRHVIDTCQVAFRLGWHVAFLHKGSREDEAADQLRGTLLVDELPSFERLPADERREGLIRLIHLEAEQLKISECCTDDPVELNRSLLTDLTAADWRWAQAYSLGASLERLTMYPNPWDPALRSRRMWELSQRLTDLKSCFQPYAVDAVQTTLSRWSARVTPQGGEAAAGVLKEALYRQGQIWSALLSGEKLATDYLQVPDYVEGAENVASTMWRLVCRTLRGARGLLAVTAAVLVVTFALVTFLGLHGEAGAAVGTLALGLGSIGVTGASLKITAIKAIGFVEERLWDAELAAAVAEACYVERRDEGDALAVLKLRSRAPEKRLQRTGARARIRSVLGRVTPWEASSCDDAGPVGAGRA